MNLQNKFIGYGAFMIAIILLQSCIGDDIINDRVNQEIRILNAIDSLGIDSTFQLETLYLNEVGEEASTVIDWTSSNTDIATISPTGLLTGISEGNAIITATVMLEKPLTTGETSVSAQFSIAIAEDISDPDPTPVNGNSRQVMIAATSFYLLTGNGELSKNPNGNGTILSFEMNYQADTRLPGLYIYLTNNPNTSAGGLEIGPVTVFNGVHSYNLPNVTNLNQYSHVLYYCKPFNVKVGDGELQ